MREFRYVATASLFALLMAAALSVLRAADDPISGSWSGQATAAEGGSSIKLALKLDGDLVTGQITTDQGTENIKDGAWRDGVLSFQATYNGVPVALKAAVKEGKLVGDFTYNQGEVLGTWQASRVQP
jgi:hypothetical protein